jgi:hypothetical protein
LGQLAAMHAKLAAAAAEHQEALRKVKEKHLTEVTKHKRQLAQLEATSAQAERVMAAADAAGGGRPRLAMPPLPGQTGGVAAEAAEAAVKAREGQLRAEFKIRLKKELENLTTTLQCDHKEELSKVGKRRAAELMVNLGGEGDEEWVLMVRRCLTRWGGGDSCDKISSARCAPRRSA